MNPRCALAARPVLSADVVHRKELRRCPKERIASFVQGKELRRCPKEAIASLSKGRNCGVVIIFDDGNKLIGIIIK